ncbi:hypothetical protein [Arthrobacter sp. B1I2]|uniref:hypothetical protein n=1 Tax=Arthrobacter sp. B1I2 TaxID=3042263 RepID=UPI0027827ECE|nr:hypothetical protein [Arthrobacter sp. B1I2]MDQ0733087.1 hypothetical protein [Arthrobacter sp. B1I2]
MTTGWEWVEIGAQFATIVTALAVFLALLQLTHGRTAKHRDFENLYVQRYWNLMDRFEGNPWTATSVDDLVESDRSRVSAYLQLCEDELDLRRNGFISTKTWGIWVDGMKSQCARPAYKDALNVMEPAELPALRDFLDNGNDDPLKMNWFVKWWTGIGNTGREPATRRSIAAEEEREAARS